MEVHHDIWQYIFLFLEQYELVICKRICKLFHHWITSKMLEDIDIFQCIENKYHLNLEKYYKIDLSKDITNNCLKLACQLGDWNLVHFCIKKGANDWNWGLEGACKGGHMKLVEFMIEKGANTWNWGLEGACKGGHMKLAELMIEKGADDWNWGLARACYGGHMKLVEIMIQKGAYHCYFCQNTKHLF